MIPARFIDDVHRRAFYTTVKAALLKGVIFWGLAMIIMDAPKRAIFGLVVALFLGLCTEFLWFYRPNMKSYILCTEKLGSEFRKEVRERVEEVGIEKLLHTNWFVERAERDKVRHTALDDI